MTASRPIRVVDLFCGAGGLWLGWRQAASERGMELLAAVDADPYLEEVYNWNFPGIPFIRHLYGDAYHENEARAVAERAGLGPGDVEVLLAGPPCQTFSTAGKRELQGDSRLVFHVCDFAEILQPKIVVIENVPEFSRAQDGRLSGRVRVRLAEAGYATEIMNVSAAQFGVPQLRMRCFILAVRKDLNWPSRQKLLQRLQTDNARRGSSSPASVKPTASSPTTVAEAIDDLPSLQAGEGEQEATLTTLPTSEYQTRLRDSENRLFNHVAVQHSPELVAALSQLKPGETPQQTPDHPLRRKDYFRSAYARLDPQKPALTMTTQTQNAGSGRFTHYRDARVITVREVARLQSFPDHFRFFGPQVVQRRHIGNAVPPLLAQAIAAALLPLLAD